MRSILLLSCALGCSFNTRSLPEGPDAAGGAADAPIAFADADHGAADVAVGAIDARLDARPAMIDAHPIDARPPMIDAHPIDAFVADASGPDACIASCAGQCGTFFECGTIQTCGGCTVGFCNTTSHVCQCNDESVAKTCGDLCTGKKTNNCGHAVDCSTNVCANPDTCGGGTDPTRCGCTAAVDCTNGGCGTYQDSCGGFQLCGTTCPVSSEVCDFGTNLCCTPDTKTVTCTGRCGYVFDNCGEAVNCGGGCGGSGITCCALTGMCTATCP